MLANLSPTTFWKYKIHNWHLKICFMYLHTIIVKLLLSIYYIKIVTTKMHWFCNKFAISISWCCKKYAFYSTLYWGNVKWWYWYIQGLQTWCKYREYNDCICFFFLWQPGVAFMKKATPGCIEHQCKLAAILAEARKNHKSHTCTICQHISMYIVTHLIG